MIITTNRISAPFARNTLHVAVAVALILLSACEFEAKTLRISCDDGNAEDCNELGRRVAEGDHVLRDPTRAAVLFDSACDGGVAEGCYRLGIIHQDSMEVDGAPLLVVSLFERACDGSEMRGCTSLGLMYMIHLEMMSDHPADMG